MKIRIRHSYRSSDLREESPTDLLVRACTYAAWMTSGQLENVQAEHAHLLEIVGALLGVMLDRGVLTTADLPEMVGSLGDWEIVCE
jgi:hypothetical protein